MDFSPSWETVNSFSLSRIQMKRNVFLHLETEAQTSLITRLKSLWTLTKRTFPSQLPLQKQFKWKHLRWCATFNITHFKDWKNSNHGFETSVLLFSVKNVPVATKYGEVGAPEEYHINDISSIKDQNCKGIWSVLTSDKAGKLYIWTLDCLLRPCCLHQFS